MKKKQIKIWYTIWGLANNLGTHIEINKQLKYNKPLRDYIIKHELSHDLNKFDLGHEFFSINWGIMPKLFWFIITNPKTWIDFLPLQIKKRKLIYDTNMLWLYLIIALIVFGAYLFI